MGLSVNSNIAAMNAYRNLSVTNNSMSKSLEKLSSGYRINRAADDAAGLAISEGLKSQIGGLTVAVRNTQDGISVVQTAEGALTETHSILQRMRDLSVQASNAGSTNPNALQNIQSEIGQLKSELDRIAGTTNFNGQNLLDGSYNKTFQVGANAGQTIGVSIGSPGKGMDSTGLGVAGVDVTKIGTYGTSAVTVATAAADNTAAVLKITHQGSDDFGSASGTVASFKNLTGTISFGGKTFDLGSVDYSSATSQATALTALNNAAKSALGLATNPFSGNGASDLQFQVGDAIGGYTETGGAPVGSAAGTPTVNQLDLATPTFTPGSGASAAIGLIDTAIGSVSTTRAQLGAVQNRFEHTINNLNVAVENLTASNSRIRDTDMAQEMTNFTRAQILTQAGTAMLAQANQAPQGILKLLG
jgi:flagellin-like hook-associated protein FlgL